MKYYDAYGGIGTIAVLIYLLMLALLVVEYVFTGLSLYQIGKRRGLRNYGLAWVPLGDAWMITAIGDQYEGIRTGRKQSLRWWTLGLLAGTLVLSVVTMVAAGFFVVDSFTYRDELSPEQIMRIGGSGFAMAFSMLLMMPAAIAGSVLTYISLYRLYRSTRPEYAVVYLVLSIVIPVTMPFFLFACRKYDAPIEMVMRPAPPQHLPPQGPEQ